MRTAFLIAIVACSGRGAEHEKLLAQIKSGPFVYVTGASTSDTIPRWTGRCPTSVARALGQIAPRHEHTLRALGDALPRQLDVVGCATATAKMAARASGGFMRTETTRDTAAGYGACIPHRHARRAAFPDRGHR